MKCCGCHAPPSSTPFGWPPPDLDEAGRAAAMEDLHRATEDAGGYAPEIPADVDLRAFLANRADAPKPDEPIPGLGAAHRHDCDPPLEDP